ncbi:MAG: glycosyltransferase family 1 protein [Candidatus Cloacimonadaceae bacterium]|nr:glycosyltransferase family 1 protein [Candidatus Cloacimonadaceae bacterium]
MKIFVSCIAFDEGKSGISDYITSVVRIMLREHKVYLLIYQAEIPSFPLRHENLIFIPVRNYLKNPLISMFWHLYCLPFTHSWKQYDLVFLPAGNRRLFARYPAHTVVTFHDLSQFHIPHKYDRLRMAYIRLVIPHYIKKAPHIFAISENTKNDMLRYYHMEPHQIKVNYNGYDRTKLENVMPEAELRTRLGLQKPYLLYISRLEHPGKNHLNLIRAYELLSDSIRQTYDLVLAGSPWSGSEAVYAYAEKSPCKSSIHFTGFISNELLAPLYKYAKLYVFPSLYEGFGIPMLEAMASGLPVICANRSSLPEIGGNAVLSFDPELPAEIAAKIELVLLDEDQYRRMRERGLVRASYFSWEEHVQTLIQAINKPGNL